MKIELKQEVIEKNVLLETEDRIIIADFLRIMKVAIDLLKENEDFYVTSPNGEELDDADLEYIFGIFEGFLNEGEITITKC